MYAPFRDYLFVSFHITGITHYYHHHLNIHKIVQYRTNERMNKINYVVYKVIPIAVKLWVNWAFKTNRSEQWKSYFRKVKPPKPVN